MVTATPWANSPWRYLSGTRARSADRCGLCCKRDVSVVRSDEMICILGAFAAARTNDPGCTPRVVIYGLCGGITKGLARGPSIRRGQVPARRHTRRNRRHRGLLPGHWETARLQRLLRAVRRNLGCGRHRMAGPGRVDQERSADPVRGRRPPAGDRADARAPGPRRLGFRTGSHRSRPSPTRPAESLPTSGSRSAAATEPSHHGQHAGHRATTGNGEAAGPIATASTTSVSPACPTHPRGGSGLMRCLQSSTPFTGRGRARRLMNQVLRGGADRRDRRDGGAGRGARAGRLRLEGRAGRGLG